MINIIFFKKQIPRLYDPIPVIYSTHAADTSNHLLLALIKKGKREST